MHNLFECTVKGFLEHWVENDVIWKPSVNGFKKFNLPTDIDRLPINFVTNSSTLTTDGCLYLLYALQSLLPELLMLLWQKFGSHAGKYVVIISQ